MMVAAGIGDEGCRAICELLKSNAALTELHMICQEDRTEEMIIFKKESIGAVNSIGESGRSMIDEALKSNSSLTKLDLEGEKDNGGAC